MKARVLISLCGVVLAASCGKEPPPRSVDYFLRNPIVLEAVVVRCNEDRYATRYDQECINVREAASRVSPEEEEGRREEFEAQFEVKRDALRRQQEAADERQRLAAEAEEERREAEYIMQFGELPPPELEGEIEAGGNSPQATIIEAGDEIDSSLDAAFETDTLLPASSGSNAPVAEIAPSDEPAENGDE